MIQAIKDLPTQFAYQPKIVNRKKLKSAKQFVVLGMGGSHLAADLLKLYQPNLKLTIHSDYDLPLMFDKELKQSLIIANSYSGNTEEVIDGLKLAKTKKLNVVCVATGGKLIKFAKDNNLAYVQMPNTGIQPRNALGFNARALTKVMGLNKIYAELGELAKTLKPAKFQKVGKKLAKKLKNKMPIIYSSVNNLSLAYNWKIKFNETGKIPAFYNILPELNHNEMNGFDVRDKTKQLSAKFQFIFLIDENDHPRIQKRFKILAKLYRARKLPVLTIPLKGKNLWQKIFANLTLADWTAYYVAKSYNIDPEPVPMVEKFKILMK